MAVCLAGMVASGVSYAIISARPAGIERAAAGYLLGRVARELGVEPGGPMDAAVRSLIQSVPAAAKEIVVLRTERLRETLRRRATPPGEESPPGTAAAHGVLPRVEAAYQRRLAALVHELRVFTGCNALLFGFTAMLLAWRGRQAPYLLVPAGILTLSTGAAAILYLITQDWLWAFVSGHYFGYGYLVLVGLLAALLIDIAFNEARACQAIAQALWWWHV
jgi:hypothetical protein